MSTQAAETITDFKSIGAGVMMYMLAPLGMTLIPLLVGAAATDLNLSDSQVGYLASADLIGLAITAVTAAFWIRKISWQIIAMTCIGVIALGNLFSVLADSFLQLCIARFITEVGSGGIFSLALVTLGDTRNPDRYFALGIGMTIALAVGVFLWFPALIPDYGMDIIFLFHGLVAVMVFPLLFWLPKQKGRKSDTTELKGVSNFTPLLVCFIAFACFTIAEGGVWSYVERIGAAAGFSAEYVGQVLASTQVVSFITALAASALSTRFGRALPIGFGIGCFMLSLYLLLTGDPAVYMFAACLSQFAWIFVLPYLLLMCVELDPSGRFYVMTIAFKMGGFALGPALIASMLQGDGFAAVSWVGGVFLVISLVLAVPLAMSLDRGRSSRPEPVLGGNYE